MKKRDFLKTTGALALGAFLPSPIWAFSKKERLRTAHIGVSNMGAADLASISSHDMVDVVALCDVDSNALEAAKKLHPNAEVFSDYRILLRDFKNNIDAVIVSTPDHTHAPASMMAMEIGKPVYCQKPLTHLVAEARAMKKLAERKNLVTQMGIQVHSFYDYKLATILIRSGIIGRVKTVRAWSPKNWGYDGPEPKGSDSVPHNLDWNLWLGTAEERPYKDKMYHPANWRKIMDYGCGTLGDMGVHIFDTPYNALQLDVPKTITNNCRKPTGFGYPEKNTVTYEFPGTKYTADTLKWVWYDGPGVPESHNDLILPNNEKLPEQGAMFIGEKGKLLLPHFMQLPRHIIDGTYVDLDLSVIKESDNLGTPTESYDKEGNKHYHQFVDACLGDDKTSAPFSYSARLTETILLGVIAGRFPNKKLHWDSKKTKFKESEANKFLDGSYRDF
jgi:predicted dehydrogenase